MLSEALTGLVLPGCSERLGTNQDLSHEKPNSKNVDVLSYLHLLQEFSNAGSVEEGNSNVASTAGGASDSVSNWWAVVGSVAAYWLRGEDEAAERFYSTIEHVPKSLLKKE